MSREPGDVHRVRLRREAELALDGATGNPRLRVVLERLIDLSAEGEDDWVFAHRHLAEVLLEEDPWRAALYLRRILAHERQDDVVHALMGLCHALLGHYRAAVASYRRALEVAPHMPWYHHNLGHLLDVALGQPERAEPHLTRAHRMEPAHDEIAASLAHCLGRLGKLERARELAEDALAQAPRNADHRRLLEWIERGAPKEGLGVVVPAGARGSSRGSKRAAGRGPRQRTVQNEFERRMSEAGFSADQLDRARSLWSDFQRTREVRVVKPEVYAAAVEYAIALLHGQPGVTQADVARRYGVAPRSVSNRWGEIRDALALEPFDPRYV